MAGASTTCDAGPTGVLVLLLLALSATFAPEGAGWGTAIAIPSGMCKLEAPGALTDAWEESPFTAFAATASITEFELSDDCRKVMPNELFLESSAIRALAVTWLSCRLRPSLARRTRAGKKVSKTPL